MRLTSLMIIVAAMVGFAYGCNAATPTPRPDYEATIAVAQHEMSECIGELNSAQMSEAECWSQPTQTPHVIVVTPVPPTPIPVTPTPPYPANLVSCKDAPLGTRIYATNGATLRYWHSATSNNLGQAVVGTYGMLIDKSMDDQQQAWYREQGMRTNDYPYGEKDGAPLKAWIRDNSSGCVPPSK